jgi:hypothetical protein
MKLTLAIAITFLLGGCSRGPIESWLVGPNYSDWRESISRVFGAGQSHAVVTEVCDPKTGDRDHLETRCRPQSWWSGEEDWSGSFVREPAGRLTAFELWVARDADGDGHVAPSEWTLASKAALVEEADRTRAELPLAHVARGWDAVWYLFADNDWGVTGSGWKQDGLTFSMPPSAAAAAARTAGLKVYGPTD